MKAPSPIRATGNTRHLVLALLVAFSAAAQLCGCNGKTSGQAVMQTPVTEADGCSFFGSTLKGDLGRHCCANGEPLSNPPADCPMPPGTAPIQSAMQQYNAAAASGLGSQQAADKLVGDAGTAHGGAQPLALAALAGNTAAATGKIASLPGGLAGGPGRSSGQPGGGSANPSGSGGGSAGSGSGLGGLANVQTSAAPLDAGLTGDAATAGTGALAKEGASYQGGGAGMRHSSGDSGFEEPSVNGVRGNTTVAFRDPASENLSPMGTTEPENYFEMLHATDSIFKVVEHRYVQKAMQWEVSRVKNAVSGGARSP